MRRAARTCGQSHTTPRELKKERDHHTHRETDTYICDHMSDVLGRHMNDTHTRDDLWGELPLAVGARLVGVVQTQGVNRPVLQT